MRADIKTYRRERINRTANAKINVSILIATEALSSSVIMTGLIFLMLDMNSSGLFRIKEINMIPVLDSEPVSTG